MGYCCRRGLQRDHFFSAALIRACYRKSLLNKPVLCPIPAATWRGVSPAGRSRGAGDIRASPKTPGAWAGSDESRQGSPALWGYPAARMLSVFKSPNPSKIQGPAANSSQCSAVPGNIHLSRLCHHIPAGSSLQLSFPCSGESRAGSQGSILGPPPPAVIAQPLPGGFASTRRHFAGRGWAQEQKQRLLPKQGAPETQHGPYRDRGRGALQNPKLHRLDEGKV